MSEASRETGKFEQDRGFATDEKLLDPYRYWMAASQNDSHGNVPLRIAVALLAQSVPPRAICWGKHFAADIHIRIANRPPVLGAARAVRELDVFFSELASIGSRFREIWAASDGETVLLELDAQCGRADVELPLAIVMRVDPREMLVEDLRFYLDLTPLRLAE